MNPSIKTQANCQVQGYFKLSAVQGDADGNPIPGTERALTDWFPNLITDSGMELLKNKGFLSYIMVGSGSAVPAKSDTTLGAFVAGMASTVTQGPNDFTLTDYPWCSAQATCQFAKGAAAGNLSEIGVGVSQNSLFARSLIKDADGQPTTITITAIELLTVTYQWRVYFDLTYSHQDTFTINGTEYTTTTMVGAMSAPSALNFNTYGPGAGRTYIQALTGAVGGAGQSGATVAANAKALISAGPAGAYYADATVTFAATDANASLTGFQTADVAGIAQGVPLKCAVSPALVKDNTMTLSITLRLAWARKVAA